MFPAGVEVFPVREICEGRTVSMNGVTAVQPAQGPHRGPADLHLIVSDSTGRVLHSASLRMTFIATSLSGSVSLIHYDTHRSAKEGLQPCPAPCTSPSPTLTE